MHIFAKGKLNGISSNVLTNIVAGVREKKGSAGENPQLLPTIHFEVICTTDALVGPTTVSFFLNGS